MTKPGRDLEQLVEIIERILASDPTLTVRSPDFIVGRLSAVARECDVTIRRVLSDAVLVLLECRDRNRPQDLTWIEQLASKAEDVGAGLAVAVSSSGFSKAAERMARAKGIALRTLAQVTPDALALWTELDHVETLLRQFQLDSVYVELDAPPGTDLSEVKMRADQRLFRSKPLLTVHTAEEIWQVNANAVYADIPTDGRHVSGAVCLRFDDPANRFEVAIGDGWYDVVMLKFDGERWVESVRSPVSRRFEYREGEETVLDGVEALVPDNEGGRLLLGLHARPATADGSRQVSLSWRRSDDPDRLT